MIRHNNIYNREGLFEVEVKGVEQELIPYMGHLVLPNIAVKRLIIDPCADSLFDGPCKSM